MKTSSFLYLMFFLPLFLVFIFGLGYVNAQSENLNIDPILVKDFMLVDSQTFLSDLEISKLSSDRKNSEIFKKKGYTIISEFGIHNVSSYYFSFENPQCVVFENNTLCGTYMIQNHE